MMAFGLFALIPGYVAGWAANIFEFRRGSVLRQMALSVPLSVAVVPICTYLPWRFLSIRFVWCYFALVWLCFFWIVAVLVWKRIRHGGGCHWGSRAGWITGIAAAAVWAIIAVASLADLRLGARLYQPEPALDYLSRAPIAAGAR